MKTQAKFALDQFTTHRQSFEEDLRMCAELGIQAMEVCESKLSSEENRAEDQLKALRDSGLTVSSVQAQVHAVFPDQMAKEPTDPAARMDRFRRTIDRFVKALPEQSPTFVLISGGAPQKNIARAFDVAESEAAKMARFAADRGCRIGFEALHPVLMHVDSFVWSWAEGLRLLEAVGHPAFGLVCDLWHVWQEPEILARVRQVIDKVFLVHVSDWHRGGPRRLNDRLVPGEGVIPLDRWGAMLSEAGYDRFACLELLSDADLADSFYHRPVAEVVRAGREAMVTARLVDDAGVVVRSG